MSTHIHFFGVRRSGNHAVLGWVEGNANANGYPAQHHNDIHDVLMAPPKVPHYGDLMVRQGAKLAIFSYQDIAVSEIPCIPHFAEDPNLDKRRLTVVRDLRNLLASRIEMYEDLNRRGLSRSVQRIPLQTVVDMWAGYAEAYLNAPEPESGQISYPEWFTSRCYRDRVYEALDLGPNQDVALNQVSDHGFGSSFDMQRYDGYAQNMDVLERWKMHAAHPVYRQLLADNPAAVQLSTEFDATWQT